MKIRYIAAGMLTGALFPLAAKLAAVIISGGPM